MSTGPVKTTTIQGTWYPPFSTTESTDESEGLAPSLCDCFCCVILIDKKHHFCFLLWKTKSLGFVVYGHLQEQDTPLSLRHREGI